MVKVQIRKGSTVIIKEAGVSEDKGEGEISLDQIIAGRITETGFLLVDGIQYFQEGKENPNLSTHVEMEGKEGKIFQGEYPFKVKIGEVVYLRKTDKAEETNQQPAEDFSQLKQTIATAAETTEERAPKACVQEPTQEQLRHLADVIGRSREEGREEGYAKARLETEALEYEANTITNDLDAKLKQKTEEYANIVRLAEWLLAAAYAKGAEILEKYESSMGAMEGMCKGYRETIDKNKMEASELSGKISKLEKDISKLKNGTTKSEGKIEELEQKIKEMQSENSLLGSEKREYELVLEEIGNQMKGLQETKEALEIEYNQLGDNFREEIESAKRKHGEEIKGYQDMLVKEREILSKIYGWMARSAGLEPGAHPRQSSSVIELCLLQRQNLLKEVDGFRKAINQRTESPAQENYPPEKTTPQPCPLNKEGSVDILQKAAEYVILSMHISNKGGIEATLDKITDVLTRFELIDPQKAGLSEKDVKVLGYYFKIKCRGYSQSSQNSLSDPNMLIYNFIDEIRPFLNDSLLLDGASRVKMKRDLQEFYNKFEPENNRHL